jgi:hypothetical protein
VLTSRPTAKSLYLLIAFAAVLSIPAPGQRGTLSADRIIRLKGTTSGTTLVTVMPGTAPAYRISPANAQLVLDLVLEETYVLTFQHPGCVTKQLYVDTSIPIDMRTTDFHFPLMVVLEHHAEPFTYAGPVGFIFYQHRIADFSYSMDHTIVVDTRFKERMDELEHTGVDPRSAHHGYTATSSPPIPVATGRPNASPQIGTMAPLVAHTGPLVHRVVAQRPTVDAVNEQAGPFAHLASVGLTLPAAALEPPAADPTPTFIGPIPTASATAERWSTIDLLVEGRRITTIIRIGDGEAPSTEYRRVLYTTGAAYFFQDGRSISELTYTHGRALAQDIAMHVEPRPAQ